MRTRAITIAAGVFLALAITIAFLVFLRIIDSPRFYVWRYEGRPNDLATLVAEDKETNQTIALAQLSLRLSRSSDAGERHLAACYLKQAIAADLPIALSIECHRAVLHLIDDEAPIPSGERLCDRVAEIYRDRAHEKSVSADAGIDALNLLRSRVRTRLSSQWQSLK